MLLSTNSSKLQVFIDRLNVGVDNLGMSIVSPKCKMLLQNWINSKQNSILRGGELSDMDRSSFFDSSIQPGRLISKEVSSRMEKARFAFTNLKHQSRRPEI